MARAKAVSWFNLVAGLVLGATTQPLFFGTVAHAGEYLVAQASGRATQAHAALSKAIECHRQGDYEAADVFFMQVLPHLADLTASEQEDFKHFSAENVNALAARRNANRYLNYAEKALAANRQAEAAEQIKHAAPSEQYMSPDDKQRLAELNQQLRVVRSAPPQPVADPEPQPAAPQVKPASPYGATQPAAVPVANTELARAKVKQARAQLGQSNFEACEALVAEAEGMHATFAAGEDSPVRVREDLAKALADDKALLAAARGALSRKEFDSAEAYAHLAEKAGSSWSLNLFADTPAKVLRDVQAARSQAAQGDKPAPGMLDSMKGVFGGSKPDASPYAKPTPADNQSVTANASPVTDETPDGTEAARKLLKDGRAALKKNDLALAKLYADQARALKPQLMPGEDTPDKLLNDIVRADSLARTPKAEPKVEPKPVADAAKPKRSQREEALELLRLGREQLAAMKIDDAMKSAVQAKTLNVKWGLFEDTPDTLARDVDKARARHNQDESARVLAEGRKLLEKKDYDGAMKAAYHAQALHGTYYIWDLGDRPENLLADVEAGRAHQRKSDTPTGSALAKKDNPPPAPPPAAPPADKLVRNDSGVRPVVATEIQPVSPVVGTTAPFIPGAGTPPPPPAMPAEPALDANPVKPIETVVKPVADTNRLAAVQLLGEARELFKAGNLIEARLKCLEAEKLHVAFGTDEESPGELSQKLTVAAGQRVQGLLLKANDLANDGAKPEAQRYQLAEDRLTEARDLTAAYGLDTQMVDGRLAWVRRMKNLALAGPKATTPGTMPAVEGTPRNAVEVFEETPHNSAQDQGLAKLNEARRLLRSGNTIAARKQAEEAAQDQYAVTDQAFEVLREIDKEEFLQKQLQEQHKFMVVDKEFNRGDFANARALLDTVNTKLLSEPQHLRLKEILQTPEMQPAPETALVQGPGDGATTLPPPNGAHVHVSDSNPQDSLLKATEAMRTVQYDKLRKQGMEAQRQAADKFRTGQADAAIDTLKEFLDGLANEHLDASQLAMLKRPVEQRLEQFRLLKEQDDFRTADKVPVGSQMSKVENKKRAEENKQQRVSELMKQAAAFDRDHKFEEAQRYYELAAELDPDNGTASAALLLVQRQIAVHESNSLTDGKKKFVESVYQEELKYGPYTTGEKFPSDLKDKKRGLLNGLQTRKPIDREIEAKMNVPVGMHFSNTPLSQAMDDLHNLHNINFVIDATALANAGINPDIAVSIKLENITLKSALKLLLKNVGLTYVTKDEVVQITTPENARGNLMRNTIQVADLVIPIENSITDVPFNHYEVPPATGTPAAPAAPASTGGISGGTSTGSPSGTSPFASLSSSNGTMNGDWNKHKASKTMEESLINLITSSIEPNSWNNMGGPGTIQYFGPTMSLVINQTVDIQEQIQDLLASLRALQDQEVAIEVRFITIADDFYERIGVDFNLDIQTNNSTAKFQPSLLSSVFSPQGFLNNPQFAGKGLISGLTPAGTLTNDLSIPINANSFNASFPQFGGYIPGTGGIDVGLAFLSDIQVFLFLEAVAGDVRTNVMTAPKLTLENGQIATISVQEGTRNFLASVNYTLMNNQVVAQPIILNAATQGVTLTIQAVISADRRFVRMNPQITLSNTSNTTPTATIPLQLPLFPTLTDFTNGQQPVLFTEYLSAPSTNFVSVNTTVTVPDGGTVLMGGLKIMSEGRNEYGAPILSKIPYIDRLFRNTSYGRDSRSLMLMVTPRIIIQSEEEERETGYVAPRPGALQ